MVLVCLSGPPGCALGRALRGRPGSGQASVQVYVSLDSEGRVGGGLAAHVIHQIPHIQVVDVHKAVSDLDLPVRLGRSPFRKAGHDSSLGTRRNA
jgi:hypothetical protein